MPEQKVTRREAIGGGLLVSVASMVTYAIDKLTAEPSVPISYLREQTRIWMEALKECERQHGH